MFQASRTALLAMKPDTRAWVLRSLDRLGKQYCRSGTAAFSASLEALANAGLARANHLPSHDRETLIRMFGGEVTGDAGNVVTHAPLAVAAE